MSRFSMSLLVLAAALPLTTSIASAARKGVCPAGSQSRYQNNQLECYRMEVVWSTAPHCDSIQRGPITIPFKYQADWNGNLGDQCVSASGTFSYPPYRVKCGGDDVLVVGAGNDRCKKRLDREVAVDATLQ